MLKNVKKNDNKTRKKNKLTDKELLIIHNEFTPSKISASLTDEKLYKK